jgi:hypothetical protein
MQCITSIKKNLSHAMLGGCRMSCKLQLNIIYDVIWLKCCSFALKYEVLLNCLLTRHQIVIKLSMHYVTQCFLWNTYNLYFYLHQRGRGGRDRKVVGFATTYASSADYYVHGYVYSIQHYVIQFYSIYKYI